MYIAEIQREAYKHSINKSCSKDDNKYIPNIRDILSIFGDNAYNMTTNTISPKITNSPAKVRMEDDPRFLTLLAGLGGSCLSQFEIHRKVREYGEDTIENLASDEEYRLQELTDRVWDAAVRLYKRLTKDDVISEFNRKVTHAK